MIDTSMKGIGGYTILFSRDKKSQVLVIGSSVWGRILRAGPKENGKWLNLCTLQKREGVYEALYNISSRYIGLAQGNISNL